MDIDPFQYYKNYHRKSPRGLNLATISRIWSHVIVLSQQNWTCNQTKILSLSRVPIEMSKTRTYQSWHIHINVQAIVLQNV